jgi:ribosomal protein L5
MKITEGQLRKVIKEFIEADSKFKKADNPISVKAELQGGEYDNFLSAIDALEKAFQDVVAIENKVRDVYGVQQFGTEESPFEGGSAAEFLRKVMQWNIRQHEILTPQVK